jgi:hypothetical protein
MKLAGLLFAGFLIGAQTTTVPVDEEPKHKVVLKNDFVRILDATLPAGYVTLNHAHAADNVSVTISNGREGEAALRGIGRAGFSKGGYSHTVSNPGPGVMRYIVVEPFKPDRPNAAATVLPHHTLETENDKVRIYRMKLETGEAMESHAHTSGYVAVTVAGPGGTGASSWISSGENHPLKTPVAGPAVEVVEIEPK